MSPLSQQGTVPDPEGAHGMLLYCVMFCSPPPTFRQQAIARDGDWWYCRAVDDEMKVVYEIINGSLLCKHEKVGLF